MRNCQSSPDAEPDLTRLGRALIGAVQRYAALEAALGVLSSTAPKLAWAILSRVESGRFDAVAGDGISHGALRMLVEQSCGPRVFVAVHQLLPENGVGGAPLWSSVPPTSERTAGEPDVVLGCWSKTSTAHPALAANTLEIATEMIESAVRAARIFEYLLDQSSRDPLTGLLNRRGIIETLEREAARSVRARSSMSVLYLDLDRFKSINDRFGHAAGDRVLVTIGNALSRALRASDALGRMGGDEFLIVLPDTDRRTAGRIGRRLEETLRRQAIRVGEESIEIGVTFGTSCMESARDPRGLVDLADRELLLRKRRKRERAKPATARIVVPA